MSNPTHTGMAFAYFVKWLCILLCVVLAHSAVTRIAKLHYANERMWMSVPQYDCEETKDEYV